MWNYRVVRKRNVSTVAVGKKESVNYTYAIHEAYYDRNGHVGAITQDPVQPFGENIEELRHAWVMMAEAFGLPILNHDNIPEPGYERKEDPIASVLDERLKEMEAGNVKGIPWEEVRRDLEAKCGPFDEEAYDKELEEERIEKEKTHGETFIGTSTFEELINKIYSDYREYLERDRIENPWKYRAGKRPTLIRPPRVNR
jgi:hypothetical protein